MIEKSWSSGNSYLRLLSSSLKEDKRMTISMLSVSELQLVSEAIQILDKRMSTGKVRPKWAIEISLHADVSREMSS